jgi:arylformamidase
VSLAGPWIDISARLDAPLPAWPGSRGLDVSRTHDLAAGDHVTETFLAMDVHCGTHVDAPAHVLVDGGTLSTLPIESFIGPVLVVELLDSPVIEAADIEAAVPEGTPRVLFRTDNSERRLMRAADFVEDFVALSVKAAAALAARPELVLMGNDYLSIQPYGGDVATHHLLLQAGIAALEGLDLIDVKPGWYNLVALPLRLDGAEAAPMRALLGPIEMQEQST